MSEPGPHRQLIDRKAFTVFWQKRNNPKELWKFAPVYLAGIACFLPATSFLNDHPLFVVIWFTLFFAYLLGMPFLWNRLLYGKADPRFLKCPVCGRSLGPISQIVIATGTCGHCGSHILVDHDYGEKEDLNGPEDKEAQ